jgi:electron transfer flavoprotein alpha subunit
MAVLLLGEVTDGQLSVDATVNAKLARNYSHIVAPATADAKNALPRVAALLDVMVISDVSDARKVVSIRTSTFESAGKDGSAPVGTISAVDTPGLAEWVEEKVAASDRPQLTSVDIVLSGRRGVGSKDDFHPIEKLADKLGAAVGASRAAIDSGYAPNDCQVGQVVAPDLSTAVGISGAIQHLAGMKDTKVVVAINKDEKAPIYQVADCGLIADLFQAVPELNKSL